MNPRLIVWWVLWAAFQIGIVVLYTFLATTPHAGIVESGNWIYAAVPVLISAAVRWVVLPIFPTAERALPIVVLGISMTEATCFLGIFIFPLHQQQLSALSFLGILQFIPLFAGKYG